ncbi:hypothetical protein [Mesorhizobium sp. ORS 3428]|uniref:hypothetical protein n=1 Tax=Mesorhizobium sp. ORS 3428 TaxID=540997 RepID=UPI00104245E3|nr:hypothetical protein [Mesorhizobium sp. ORS 3428]
MAIEEGNAARRSPLTETSPAPGRCGVVAIASNPMTRVGLRRMADGLPTLTGLAQRNRPEARPIANIKTRGNIAGQIRILAICAKAFVADAASSDRTGPLGASGDAGDRPLSVSTAAR